MAFSKCIGLALKFRASSIKQPKKRDLRTIYKKKGLLGTIFNKKKGLLGTCWKPRIGVCRYSAAVEFQAG